MPFRQKWSADVEKLNTDDTMSSYDNRTGKTVYTDDQYPYMKAAFFWSADAEVFWICSTDVGDSAVLFYNGKVYPLDVLTSTKDGYVMYYSSDNERYYKVPMAESHIPAAILKHNTEIEQMDGYEAWITDDMIIGTIDWE